MTAPPWGHKPPAVDDDEKYWAEMPPAPSDRMVYWARRMREGSWTPNTRILRECYQCRAGMLGVYLWEAKYAFAPMAEHLAHPEKSMMVILADTAVKAQGYRDTKTTAERFQHYWRLLAELSDPANVGG